MLGTNVAKLCVGGEPAEGRSCNRGQIGWPCFQRELQMIDQAERVTPRILCFQPNDTRYLYSLRKFNIHPPSTWNNIQSRFITGTRFIDKTPWTNRQVSLIPLLFSSLFISSIAGTVSITVEKGKRKRQAAEKADDGKLGR